MDAATLNLIFDLAKVTLPTLITALAAVWAAKAGKGSPAKGEQSAARELRLVLELDAGDVTVSIDPSGRATMPKGAPQNAGEVVRIRLERS